MGITAAIVTAVVGAGIGGAQAYMSNQQADKAEQQAEKDRQAQESFLKEQENKKKLDDEKRRQLETAEESAALRREKQKSKARLAGGRAGTIRTGPLGVIDTGGAKAGGKTLLGQ